MVLSRIVHTKPFIVIRISVFICFGFILVAYFYIRYHYSNNRIRKRALEKVNKRIALIPSTVYKEQALAKYFIVDQ